MLYFGKHRNDMINKLAGIFQALSEPNRIRILKMLQLRSLCSCEIVEVLGLRNSTVSEHLSVLKENGFITSEKSGKIIFHKLNFYPADPAIAAVNAVITCTAENDEVIRSDREKTKVVDCKTILARNNKPQLRRAPK